MIFPYVCYSGSVSETENAAAELGKSIIDNGENNAFIALYGDLGAGKTAFVRGLASVITPEAYVSSPTYAIVNEYSSENGIKLCHFDMYRITGEEDLYSAGFYDYDDCIIAAEWSENIPFALPEDYYRVTIMKDEDPSLRKITIEHIGAGR